MKGLVDEKTSGLALDFAARRQNGCNFQLIGMQPGSSAYTSKILYSHTLKIIVPANKSRKSEAEKISSGCTKVLDDLEVIDSSPILEVVRFVAEVGNPGRSWDMFIISDLLQTSDKLKMEMWYIDRRGDKEILKEMAEVCPKVSNPPKSITVYWYPGMINEEKSIDLDDHKKIRSLFMKFFKNWAGKRCVVEMKSLEDMGNE